MESMLHRLSAHYRAFPFPRHQDTAFRFYFDNPFFACHDACILFSMLLEFKPRCVIEIGSGFIVGFGLVIAALSGVGGAALLAASLDYRQRTGKGQWIDLSQFETGVSHVPVAVLDYVVNGRVATRR
jgi:hypothetical protein